MSVSSLSVIWLASPMRNSSGARSVTMSCARKYVWQVRRAGFPGVPNFPDVVAKLHCASRRYKPGGTSVCPKRKAAAKRKKKV